MKNKQLFLKYLFSTLFSSAIVSIYSIVDSVCIGQYSGSTGSAAIAACMPIWTIVYSFGILFGVGGATVMTSLKSQGKIKDGNSYFTISFVLTAITALIIWVVFFLFRDNLLIFFGEKNEEVLEASRNYSFYIMIAIPFFVFVNFFMFFVRNDNDPILATVATVVGGVFNVFGDIFFVFDFGLGMGIKGAGLATAIGQALTIVILCIHFFKKTNTLKFEKISNIFNKIFNILKIGVSAFILDICMGVVVVIFNNQINLYTSNNASILGIYGIICNMQTLVQGFAYSVGQANQPLLSAEYGKNNKDAIKELHRYGLISSLIIGFIFFLIFMILPNVIIRSFINTKLNPEVIDIGPKYLRMYFATVPILAINVYLTYYYQSVQKAGKSFITSICRGFIFPLIFLFILPVIKFDLIFLAIPLGEIIVFIMNIFFQKTPLKIENNLKLL